MSFALVKRTAKHGFFGHALMGGAAASVTVLTCVLAWVILRDASSSHELPNWSSVAEIPDNASPEALLAAGRRLLARANAPGDLAAARELGRRALIADPLLQGSLLLLSEIAAKQGDTTRSQALLRLAAARSLRDVASQSKLVDLLIAQGDYARAFDKADMLLRTRGDISSAVMGFLASGAVDPRTWQALADFLARGPDWRGALFYDISVRYKDPAVGLRLLKAVAAKGATLTPGDFGPVVNQLFAMGRPDKAYIAWLGLLPADQRAKAAFVFDGDFTLPPANLPFEWVAQSSPGASVARVEGAGPENKPVLRLEFVGAGVPYLSVKQTLYLAPGAYRLAAEAMAEDLRAPEGIGIGWRVSCFGGKAQTLVETTPLRDSQSWFSIGADFVVPPKDCDLQTLQLILNPESSVVPTASGTVAFSGIKVTRRDEP